MICMQNNPDYYVAYGTDMDRAVTVCLKHADCGDNPSATTLWAQRPEFQSAFAACTAIWKRWQDLVEQRHRDLAREYDAKRAADDVIDLQFVEDIARSIR